MSSHVRPPVAADARAVAELFRASDGVRVATPEQILARWLEPGVRDASRVVETNTELVAYAEVAARDAADPGWDVDVRRQQQADPSPLLQLIADLGVDQVVVSVDGADAALVAALEDQGLLAVRHRLAMGFDLRDLDRAGLPQPADLPWADVPDGIRVRRMQPTDAHDVWGFFQDALAGWSNFQPMAFDDWTEGIMQPLRDSEQVCLVAHDPGGLIGALLASTHAGGDPRAGSIELLAVRPSARRRGVARALLRVSFRRFAEAGCTRVELEVDDASVVSGAALYASAGMRLGMHEIVMRRPAR